MRRMLSATVLLGAIMSLPTDSAPAQDAPDGYRLVWSDEFDGAGAPDPSKWAYEQGFVRNNEAQYYTRDRRENARLEGGKLVIEGRRERFANPRYDANHAPNAHRNQSVEFADYTSASLNTSGLASWCYGRIEVRAKLPRGKGVWPAIWMLGDRRATIGWPACGEIDIMEFVGHTPHQTHATLHWKGPDGKHKSNGKALTVSEPWADFHTYAVDWTGEAMVFTYDDQVVHRFNVAQADRPDGTNPFREPQYLLINLALGGSWGREIDDSIFPQRYEIDYVRVYQRPAAP